MSLEDNAREYLRRVDDAYIFNLTSELYQPKTQQPENKEDQDVPQQKEQPPFLVSFDGERHWLANAISLGALVVSALTLILLCYTVQYARNQWHEERRTADASITAAEAARRSAEIASQTLVQLQAQTGYSQQSLEQSKQTLAFQTRPWLRIELQDVSAKTLEWPPEIIPSGSKKLQQERKQRSVTIRYRIHNYGGGIATREMSRFYWEKMGMGSNMPPTRDAACRKAIASIEGFAQSKQLLPTEETELRTSTLDNPLLAMDSTVRAVGCVVYRGRDDPATIHHYAIQIGIHVGENRPVNTNKPPEVSKLVTLLADD